MNGRKRRTGYHALLNALHGGTHAVPYHEVDWPVLQQRILQRAEIWFAMRASDHDVTIRTSANAPTLTATHQ